MARRRTLLCVAVIVASSLAAHAQSLLSVTSSIGSPVVRVDPATGSAQTVLATGATAPDFGLGTFDPVRRRLFFLNGFVGAQELVTVDLTSSSVTTVPVAIPAAYLFIQYDQATGRIFSVTNAPGTPLVAIDPSTGASATLLVTGIASPDFGLRAFEPVSRRLYFLSGPPAAQNLVTIDLSTNGVSVHPIPLAGSYLFFEFDPATGRVLSLTNQPGSPLIAIDPATGSTQTLFNTGAPQPDFGLSAIDVVGHQLFFLNGPVGSQSLFTVNLTAQTASSVPAAMLASYLLFEVDPAPIPAFTSAMLGLLALTLVTVALWTARAAAGA